MKPQQTLEARTAGALGNKPCAADDLQLLIPDLEAGIEEAGALAEAERARSLDPTTSPQEGEQAAQRAGIAELKRERLKAALPRIEQKLASALAQDYADKWNADANKVAARVDAATEQLTHYVEWAELIAVALAGAEAVNKDVERINGSAPDNVHHRIEKVALQAFKTLVLPDPQHSNRNLWPPHQVPIAVQYAATMGAPAHPGADWANEDWQRQRGEVARAATARHAAHHEQMARLQEERDNREARENFARRP